MQTKNTTRNIHLGNQCRRTRTSTDSGGQRVAPPNRQVHPTPFDITPERPEVV